MVQEGSAEKARWLRDLARFLPLRSQFVLSGNTRDLQILEVAPGQATAAHALRSAEERPRKLVSNAGNFAQHQANLRAMATRKLRELRDYFRDSLRFLLILLDKIVQQGAQTHRMCARLLQPPLRADVGAHSCRLAVCLAARSTGRADAAPVQQFLLSRQRWSVS